MGEFLPWHQVGQAVTLLAHARCVVAKSELERLACKVPTYGEAYTIREVLLDPRGNVCFRLKEITNPKAYFADAFGEPMFDARAFRPVKSTSIEHFRTLLNPTPADHARFLEELVDMIEATEGAHG